MSNNINQLINSFTLFKFIKDITTPYNKMKLYDNGIIDETGEIIDSDNILPYDQLILSIKKLLKQIPNPNTKAKLKNLTTAISLFSEDIEKIGGDKDYIFQNIMNYLNEELSVGGGGISGVSPNPENVNDLPDTFLSKKAQSRHVRNTMRRIIRRKNDIN
jgi:hypothetical protein